MTHAVREATLAGLDLFEAVLRLVKLAWWGVFGLAVIKSWYQLGVIAVVGILSCLTTTVVLFFVRVWVKHRATYSTDDGD